MGRNGGDVVGSCPAHPQKILGPGAPLGEGQCDPDDSVTDELADIAAYGVVDVKYGGAVGTQVADYHEEHSPATTVQS